MTLVTELDLAIGLTGFIIAIIPTVTEVIKPKITGININFFKRLKPAFYFTIFLVLVIIALLFWKDNEVEKITSTSEKKLGDKLDNIEAAMKNNHQHYDSASGKLVADTVYNVTVPPEEVKEEPLLEIVGGPTMFINNGSDSVKFVLYFQNFKNGYAKNISNQVGLIHKVNGVYSLIQNTTYLDNDEIRIGKGGTHSISGMYNHTTYIPSDSVLVFYKIKYSNEDGILQKPIRRIYLFPKPKDGVVMFDLNADDYNKAKTYLDVNKLW